MKNDDKQKNFEATQSELNEKIESIMGPTPEVAPSKGAKSAKEVDSSSDTEPAGPPAVPSSVVTPDKTPEAEDEPEIEPEAETPPAELDEGDSELDEAVDDIAAKEGDEVLAAQDKELKAAFESKPKQTGGQKLKAFFKNWWANKKARRVTILAVILLLVGLAVFPITRYFFLNTVGVRASASIIVLDDSTQQPLRNVQVSIAGQTGVTDQTGAVSLQKLKLGSTNLSVERRAFATIERKVTVGWGSNPLGEFKLVPVGAQYSFVLTDFLAGTPIDHAEAISGDASAFSDDKGKVVLTLDKTDALEAEVKIKADDYREETLTLVIASKDEQQVKMVPARKHTFVSKRSGKYDVYRIDVDGTNEQLVLSGTGSERNDMVLAPHPTGNLAALVSTRDNMRNSDGFLLSTLTLLDLGSDKIDKLGSSERVQIIGWISDHLVYVEVAAGTSAGNPKRHRLMSYNTTTAESKEIASSNYFNDVMIAGENIYYAPSAAYQNGIDVSLFKVKADGSNRQTILAKETWNIFRSDYSNLSLAIGQDWYDYALADSKPPVKQNGAPANPKNRIYIDSPDKKHSLWIDERDGKGVLLNYDTAENKEDILKTQSGLKYPIRWIGNSTIVYRINTDQETADYVLNVNGGEPQKIRDVTNTGGIDEWYYY